MRAYLRLFWARKWLIIGVVAVLVSTVAAWSYRQTPIYRSSIALIVDQQMPRILNKVRDVVDISPHAYRDVATWMATQTSVACGTEVVARVAKRLNLPKTDEFWPIGTPKRRRTLAAATGRLAGTVSCTGRKKASILDISVTHPSPRMTAKLASAMAQAYMDHNVEHKLSSTTVAVKWLAKQLGTLKAKLNKAEEALYDFRKKNDLISFTLADKRGLLTGRLRRLSADHSGIRSRRLAIVAELEQLGKLDLDKPGVVPVLKLLRTQLVDRLKLQLTSERQKLKELSDRYLSKHPQVIAQQTRVSEAREALAQELRNIVAGINRELAKTKRNEQLLAGAMGETKREAFEVNKRVMAYHRLEREAESAKKIYQMVLSRMTESELSGQLRANNVRLLEGAFVPGVPISPRTKRNLLLALVLGIFGGMGLVLLLEMLDASVVSPEDVQAADLVYLGSLPPVEGTPVGSMAAMASGAESVRELVAQQYPRSRAAEDCRAIRTNLLFASPDRALKTLVVTSPTKSEGKSLTATNLAFVIAQQGSKVLLIDADMRSPTLHRIFGVPRNEGLSTALKGEVEISRLVKHTETENLFVLPAGELPPNPAELCHSLRLRRLLAGLGDRFDLLIIDTPPVLPVTDAVVLSAFCDGTLLVARAGQTAKEALRTTARRLIDVGAKPLGCVINELDPLGPRYRYRYARSVYAAGYEVTPGPAEAKD